MTRCRTRLSDGRTSTMQVSTIGARKYCTQDVHYTCSRYPHELPVLYGSQHCSLVATRRYSTRMSTPQGLLPAIAYTFSDSRFSSNPLHKLQVKGGENWPGTILKRDWISVRPRYWPHTPHFCILGLPSFAFNRPLRGVKELLDASPAPDAAQGPDTGHRAVPHLFPADSVSLRVA